MARILCLQGLNEERSQLERTTLVRDLVDYIVHELTHNILLLAALQQQIRDEGIDLKPIFKMKSSGKSYLFHAERLLEIAHQTNDLDAELESLDEDGRIGLEEAQGAPFQEEIAVFDEALRL